MKLNKKQGISLIVLVITIIVMIVLAAAIILSLQSSGIIGRANEAKAKSDVANAKQVVTMAKAEWELDEAKIRKEDSSIQSFNDYVNKKLNEAGYTTSGNGGLSPTENGAVNTIYIGSDNRQAIIPEGFIVSSVSSEDTVTEGLVIKDEDENEFVWVPVDSYDEFITINWNNGDDFWSDEVTEPFSREYNGIMLSLANDLTGEHAEYAKMKESVKKYGGFYIGRYEAGTTTERKADISNNTTELVVKKNMNVYNYAIWGQDMVTVSGDTIDSNGNNQGKCAVELSRDMYKNSSSVVSTLCYGVQWDAALKFISTNEEYATYPTYSTEKGHYSVDENGDGIQNETEGIILTGSIEAYETNNIYDMAGNAWEWTMEPFGNNIPCRMMRGGSYDFGSLFSVSYRMGSHLTGVNYESGFRVSLYLK